jgi:hypothetical protein
MRRLVNADFVAKMRSIVLKRANPSATSRVIPIALLNPLLTMHTANSA